MLLPLLLGAQVALTPHLVKDMRPEKVPELSVFKGVGRGVGDVLFFRAGGAEPGLWCTDGTEAGTYRVFDELPDHQIDGDGAVTVAGNAVYAPILSWRTLRRLDAGETNLVTSDGTTPGTHVVGPISEWLGGASCGEGKVCFVGAINRIGVTDGTAAGTAILVQTSPRPALTPWASEMTAFGKRAFFNTVDEDAGRCIPQNDSPDLCGELWITDGTAAGTHLFKDLNPGSWPSTPEFFFVSKRGKLYFRSILPNEHSLDSRCVFWSSDGTPEGTQPLRTDDPFLCTTNAAITEAGGHVYYLGGGGVMQTDGTSDSTVAVWPKNSEYSRSVWNVGAAGESALIATRGGLWASRGAEPIHLVDGPVTLLGSPTVSGLGYFALSGDLWSSDGTADGTRKLFRLPDSRLLAPVATTPRQFYYRNVDMDLFVSDGTESGTRRIELSTPVGASSFPKELLPFGDKMFFATGGPTFTGPGDPSRYNISDGTAAGTFPLATLLNPEPMFLHEGRVYYRDSSELWTTDGTAAGTRRVSDWLGAPGVSNPPSFIGQTAIFAAAGQEEVLMRRDADGTVTSLGLKSGFLREFVAVGDRVAFWKQADGGISLMITDGTSAGTKLVAEGVATRGWLLPFGDRGLFAAWSPAEHVVLWSTDFTEAGTHPLKTISTAFDNYPKLATTWQGLAILAVGNFDPTGEQGQIVWRSDGTPEGTFALSDQRFDYVLAEGSALTLIRQFYIDSNTLGWEIWTSDGSTAGTRLLTSGKGMLKSAPFTLPTGEVAIAHMNGDSELDVRTARTNRVTPVDLGMLDLQFFPAAYAGGRLYFRGCRTATGCELWSVPLNGTAERADTATLQITYRGTAQTATGRAAVFRVHMETSGTARPTVVATTVDGTLTAANDYVPFTRTIFFDDDRDVTLVVPLRSEDRDGTMSVVLSSPVNASIEQAMATAVIAPPRRRAARH
jgi:ELWxxDGT repeat protein